MDSIYKDTVKDALYPNKKGVVTRRNKFMKIEGVRPLGAEEIRRTRHFLQLSVAMFASLMNVSVKTVEAWERGDSTPSGSSVRLMNMIRKNPDILIECGVVSDLTAFRSH